MFGAFKKLSSNLNKINQNKMIEDIVSIGYVQTLIVELNQIQMEAKGIDSKGDSLGEYSKRSVEVFGKNPGHITLYDTGAFYDSMKVLRGNAGFIITGDTIKEGGVDISKKWPDALGLTEESLTELRPVMQKEIVKNILNVALK